MNIASRFSAETEPSSPRVAGEGYEGQDRSPSVNCFTTAPSSRQGSDINGHHYNIVQSYQKRRDVRKCTTSCRLQGSTVDIAY